MELAGARSMDDPVSPTRMGRAMRDLRISVTDRCNFRCTYCMPKEIFGRDYEFLPRDQVLSFEEIERVARTFVALGVEKLRITGGEPLVRRDLPSLIAMLAALRRPDGGEIDLTLTTNGSALRALWPRPLVDGGPPAGDGLLDSLDDAVFGAMNGIDFPVEPGARRHRRRDRGGPRSGQGQHGRAARRQRGKHRPDGGAGRARPGSSSASSNTWTSGIRTAGGSTRSCPAAELVERIGATWPVEPADRVLPRRGRRPLAIHSTARGEFGVISSVTDAVLRRLHPCPAVGRGQALHLPVRGRRARRPGGAPGRGLGRGAGRVHRGRLVAAAATATRSCARPRPRRPARPCPRSRCSRWAADGRRRAARPTVRTASSTPCPHRRRTSWIRFDGVRAAVGG